MPSCGEIKNHLLPGSFHFGGVTGKEHEILQFHTEPDTVGAKCLENLQKIRFDFTNCFQLSLYGNKVKFCTWNDFWGNFT